MDTTAKILVVDDEQPIRKLFRTILQRLGYEVLSAANGEEALQILESDPPDITLRSKSLPRGYVDFQQDSRNPGVQGTY